MNRINKHISSMFSVYVDYSSVQAVSEIENDVIE